MSTQPRFRSIPLQLTDLASTSSIKTSKKWPNACRTCGGDGDVPVTEEDIESDDDSIAFCVNCLGKGKCPRCAVKLPDDWKEQLKDIDETLTCTGCKWEDGDDRVL